MNRWGEQLNCRVVPLIWIAVLMLGCQGTDRAAGATPTPMDRPAAAGTTLPPVPTPGRAVRVEPSDFTYLGAFRLPHGGERPETFAYGGNAMTFSPAGDPTGPGDGFPGSLFITGHDRLPYGELPDGSQVAEITIPTPIMARTPAELGAAAFIQPFSNVAEGFFTALEEIPRIGLAYLDVPATGPKLHLAWGQHLQPDPPEPSHAWFETDLKAPEMQGPWFIGEQSANSVNGYLFTIPSDWAEAYTGGRPLATGRFRDGGWSGMGPALFAYRPWIDAAGTPAPAGARLDDVVLLQYESSENSDRIERALAGYQHPDEWEGGAWLTTPAGKSAVLFAGTKGTGDRYWYGYVHPAGTGAPCVDADLVGQFAVCRFADGTPCPPEELVECPGHNDYRGWWSARFTAQFLLYDPADLARVVAGELAPWEPQPYAALNVDDVLFMNPAQVDLEMLGTGDQRRFRLGDVAYDPAHALLYVLELFADEASPLVHVWRLE